jgi:DNA polymerase III subunit delta'
MSKVCWPDNLKDEASADTLSLALAEGRLGHALLFVAPEVSTADAAAKALAEALLGGALPQPDFVAVRPEGKLRQIKVDPMRAMRMFLQKASLKGTKVALISECEVLNDEAANLFLKILEEPPADTTILLTSVQPHAVLPTILSRTMHFRWAGTGRKEDMLEAFTADFRAFLAQPRAVGAAAELEKMAFLAKYFSLWQGPENFEKVEGLTEEAKEALEASRKKEHRCAILAKMEATTLEHFRAAPTEGIRLKRALDALERVRRLMEFSFNEAAAFESALEGALEVRGSWFRARNFT